MSRQSHPPADVTPDYAKLDATAIALRVAERAASPVELIEAALASIELLDPSLCACTVILRDEALAAAHALERRLAAGGGAGPLAGVPVAVKDVIWVRGTPATMGTRVLADFVPEVDAACVRRMREAGAIVVAKTANPPFCTGGYSTRQLAGRTRNPWDTRRSPGGSSAGSGAAVAAGMTPLALGTDMGGSIRIPAAFCGVVGLKPTHGLVARGPCFEEGRTLNVVGPMARTVRDVALCLDVIAGADPADILSVPRAPVRHRDALAERGVAELRVAWSADLGHVELDAAVRDTFMKRIGALEREGWRLEHAHPDVGPMDPVHFVISQGERGSFAAGREGLIEPTHRAMLDAAAALPAREYHEAQVERARYARIWEKFFEHHDLLLTPSLPFAAFSLDPRDPPLLNGRPIDVDREAWWELLLVASLTGGPAISVPMGRGEDALPLGMQVLGPRFAERRCLAVAAELEAIMPWERLVALGGRR